MKLSVACVIFILLTETLKVKHVNLDKLSNTFSEEDKIESNLWKTISFTKPTLRNYLRHTRGFSIVQFHWVENVF